MLIVYSNCVNSGIAIVFYLQMLSEKGSFVCRVTSLLTRFSVGLLYLLYRLFQEVENK